MNPLLRRLPALCVATGLVVLAQAALAAASAERLADHAAVAPVTLTLPDGLHRLPLPLAVLQASRSPGLADLRVFNARGESLPFALLPSQDETPRTRTVEAPLFVWPTPVLQPGFGALPQMQVSLDARGAVLRIGPGAGAGVDTPTTDDAAARAWLVDLHERRDGERLEKLALAWEPSAAGLTRRLRVEGSDDLVQWRPLGETVLVDLPGTGQPRVLRPSWTPGGREPLPNYLRLQTDQPLALRGVRAHWTTTAGPALDRTVLRFQAQSGDAPGTWVADLGAALAARRLSVRLPQANTVVLLAVEQRPEGRGDWQTVARATAYRLTVQGQELESEPIALAAPAARHWRLRLEPGSPALEGASLDAELAWPQPWLLLAARAPAPLQLAVGREGARGVSLPPASLLPESTRIDSLPLATLGAVQPQTVAPRGWLDRLKDAGPDERRRWALWAVLVAAVGGLAWLARSLWRDVGRR